MLSVIIVEDEIDHRHGIRNAVDWPGLGLRLAGEAGDGEEGLARARELKPDILIADVRMPVMDGMALAQRAREILPHLKVIFLSGHGDFEYLSGALRVSAVDYLLKPVKSDELARALEKAASERRAEIQASREQGLLRQKLAESLPLLRERFIRDLLTGRVPAGSLSARREYLQVATGGPDYIALAVKLDPGPGRPPEGSAESQEFDRYLLSEDIAAIPEYTGRILSAWVSDRELALIIGSGPGSPAAAGLESLASQIVWHYRENGAPDPVIGVGRAVPALADIRLSYGDAREALVHYRADAGRPLVYFTDVAPGHESLLDYDEVEHNLVDLVRAGQVDNCATLLRGFLASLMERQNAAQGYVRCLFMGFMGAAERARASVDCLDCMDHEAREQRWALVDSAVSVPAIAEAAIGYCASLAGDVSTQRVSRTEQAVLRVRRAIEERYSEDLSLVECAATENLTPYYFGSLFKQVTGESFSDYLTRVRMEKAAVALLTGNDMTYEIAHRVGYANVSYFCSLFKNRYGESPKRYRETHGWGGSGGPGGVTPDAVPDNGE